MRNETANQANENRDAKGRFKPGNSGGPGNPFARQVSGLRQALLNSVTAADMQAVARALIDVATNGNVQAAKLLLSYAIGKPAPAPEPDRMDADEWEVYRETEPMKKEAAEVISAGVPKAHLHMVRTMRPLLTEMMVGQIAEMFSETPEQKQARDDQAAAECEAKLSEPGPDWPPPSPNGAELEEPPSTNGYHRNGFHLDRNGLPEYAVG